MLCPNRNRENAKSGRSNRTIVDDDREQPFRWIYTNNFGVVLILGQCNVFWAVGKPLESDLPSLVWRQTRNAQDAVEGGTA